ncbi:MAG: ATP-dependent Clp protease ATP-binding subunit ClpA [Spirochaetaceae bacterium]|jgi:ATP-dependent Clp protease ATP-binding subunit ClpA|nr:ATP-dependent Clp protease ATP-binding subunit ClpA [Spirochaetaceae bacterium]
MKISRHVQAIINGAYNEARARNHEYLTPEHILYAALNFDEVQGVLGACGADLPGLKNGMETFFKCKVPVKESGEPTQTVGFQAVLERAVLQSQSASRNVLDVADILVSLYDDERNYCSYYLRKSGVSRLVLLKTLSHGYKGADERVYSFFRSEAEGNEGREKEDGEGEKGSRPQKKSIVERFLTDITALAREGRLEPVIGREDELARTIQVLCRRMKNNPLHVGDSGVGKTAITEGLAQRIVAGEAPPLLKDFSILSLDMGALVAGTRYRGDFEERIKRVVEELLKREKVILFIDEIHTLIGTGAGSGGSLDAANILKPALVSGKLRCIGSTTHEEYNKFFNKDRALSRRFQKIDIAEPSEVDTVKILQGLKSKYEDFHRVTYTDRAIESAVRLSAQFITERRLPDKAIDVIDEAGAFTRIEEDMGANRTESQTESRVEPRMENVETQTKNRTKSRMKSDAVDVSGGETPLTITTIDTETIEHIVAKMARIPERKVGESEKDKLRVLEERLKEQVYGQDKAVEEVVKAVKRSRAGFRAGEKPVASFLFVGPTGVGKTELARDLAATLGVTMHRFDMSEYQEKHTVSRLIGSPPGYVGYEDGGLLTDAVRKQPHCVLLLDEIEKAHGDIYNILLQIMDYATLTDNTGKKADFRNAVLIMTSNAGARSIGKSLIGFGDREQDDGAIKDAVDKIFTPEFRGRLDAVVTFAHLSREIMVNIVRKELDVFKAQLAEKNVTITVTGACIDRLAEEGYSRETGARNTSRIIEDKIKNFFVDTVLFGSLSEGGSATVDWDGEYRFSVQQTMNSDL